jgi:hypothetical protein
MMRSASTSSHSTKSSIFCAGSFEGKKEIEEECVCRSNEKNEEAICGAHRSHPNAEETVLFLFLFLR